MVSNRSRGNSSVGNKLVNLDSRVSSTERRSTTNISDNAINSTQLAANSVGTDAISSDAVQEDAVARGAVSEEHFSTISRIRSDHNLQLEVGPNGRFMLVGDLYPAPSTGKALTLNAQNQIVEGLDTTELDTATSTLVANSSSLTRPAIKTAMISDLSATFNPYGGFRVSSLQALYDLMGATVKPPAGALISVENSAVAGAGTHLSSVWRVLANGASAIPLAGVPMLFDTQATMNQIATNINTGGIWNTRLSLNPFVTEAYITFNGSKMHYKWGTNKWYPWNSAWIGYSLGVGNLNIGNNGGTQARYRWENGLMHVKTWILIGSSASATGALAISTPEPVAHKYNSPSNPIIPGFVSVYDPSNGRIFTGKVQVNGEDTASVLVRVEQVTDSFNWITPFVNGQPIGIAQSEQIWTDFTFESSNYPAFL